MSGLRVREKICYEPFLAHNKRYRQWTEKDGCYHYSAYYLFSGRIQDIYMEPHGKSICERSAGNRRIYFNWEGRPDDLC